MFFGSLQSFDECHEMYSQLLNDKLQDLIEIISSDLSPIFAEFRNLDFCINLEQYNQYTIQDPFLQK
jgi:hypothetical protein